MHTWLLSNLSPASISILYMSICTVVSCFITVFLAISFHWAASEPISHNDRVHFILSMGPSVRFGFRWGFWSHTAFSWTYVVLVAFTMTAETHALINLMKANTAWITACFVVGCAWVFGTRIGVFSERRAKPDCACCTAMSTEHSGRQIHNTTVTLHQPLVANADRRPARPSKRS
ncbi:unnamed protein product [Zymoseptoria tritici ST99CH_1A5]|uniref:Uncharacterized protein n=1 Tax=Zymoseptoria tritici ST99CH_1A5 TaxID=1276529 RepID=A0A1Y6LUZ8_ZYMTR|nr:unnamed protein product [Zymoseptoria tritici ST99CH_1A5]